MLVKDVSETERRGGLLRYVFVGDTSVNYAPVIRGCPIASTYPTDVACAEKLVEAQRAAFAAGRGPWAAGYAPAGQVSAPSQAVGSYDTSYP